MNLKDFQAALQQMRHQSKQRRFVQSIELIVNFKGIDFKKQENQIDVKVNLPHATGKKAGGKTLLFAQDKAFISEMKGKFDRVIEESEIPKLDKKTVNQIVNEFDVLLAEGPVMIPVGKYLGQQLAPKGKMPKPVQPNASAVTAMLAQSGSVTRVSNKKGKFMPVVQVLVGNEKMPDNELAENSFAIFNALMPKLPQKNGNIKSVYLKETMGPPVKVGEKEAAE
ncbi:MAG: hypothetical protein JW744_05165 [Candidatus Diapherotrites archaeon]|uniref:50S ribosomal protein L1 n=1 Tax=Candidatus Iainarchaeum sp. TaxID=3101447 RepID=A0A939C541_9ARCH|nr:hypothetical protein [Candidatus Diapherotrites archaeon]